MSQLPPADDTGERYTLAEVKANLVTATGIMERTGVSQLGTVTNWRARYPADFPEPFLTGIRRGESKGVNAWYWWPAVEAFLDQYDLPAPPGWQHQRRGRMPGRPPQLTTGQREDAQRRRTASEPVAQIAHSFGVSAMTIYRCTVSAPAGVLRGADGGHEAGPAPGGPF